MDGEMKERSKTKKEFTEQEARIEEGHLELRNRLKKLERWEDELNKREEELIRCQMRLHEEQKLLDKEKKFNLKKNKREKSVNLSVDEESKYDSKELSKRKTEDVTKNQSFENLQVSNSKETNHSTDIRKCLCLIIQPL
jgi:hypothetical protein